MGQMHQHWWGIWWQMMTRRWNKWPTLEVVMTSHWWSGTINLIYCKYFVGFKNKCSCSKSLKTHKTAQIYYFLSSPYLCNGMWIYQGVNWCSLLITHHPQPFPLVFLLRRRYSTFSLRDTVCHISGVKKQCDKGSRQSAGSNHPSIIHPVRPTPCKAHSLIYKFNMTTNYL